MEFSAIRIIFCASYFLISTSQSSDIHSVINKNGQKLPLYTNIYYGISNRKSGYIWTGTYDLVPPPLDNQNASHWWTLIKYNSSNSYQMKNENSYLSHKFIYKADEGFYNFITDTGGPLADGQFLQANKKQVLSCNSCLLTSDYAQWKFTLHPDYELNANMTDFQYQIPLENILKEYTMKIYILETSIITNDSPNPMTKKFSNVVNKTESFLISHSNSITQSSKSFRHFSVRASVEHNLFNISNTSQNGQTEFRSDWGRDDTNTSGNLAQTSKNVTYTLEREITVPPFSKVEVTCYANWIENLSIPYKAKITVTGNAPRFEAYKGLDSTSMRILLSKYGFDELFLEETFNSVTFETSGTLTTSFGFDPVFSSTPVGKTRENKY